MNKNAKPKEAPKRRSSPKVKVAIVESERGWGQKIDEIKKFDTKEEAEAFIKEYNKPNEDDYAKTKRVPDWYMQAELM